MTSPPACPVPGAIGCDSPGLSRRSYVEPEPQVPAHREQDDLGREPVPGERRALHHDRTTVAMKGSHATSLARSPRQPPTQRCPWFCCPLARRRRPHLIGTIPSVSDRCPSCRRRIAATDARCPRCAASVSGVEIEAFGRAVATAVVGRSSPTDAIDVIVGATARKLGSRSSTDATSHIATSPIATSQASRMAASHGAVGTHPHHAATRP